jgi:ABC-type uncharacterized transport system substrate-binding protein
MRRIALSIVVALAAAEPALAHPHVWIDMRSSVNFDAKGDVDAIAVVWTFDEFYSQFATDGLDRNNNKKLDAAELQDLANTYAKNLKEYRYFTFVEVGGKLADVGAPVKPAATFDKGQLTFRFSLPLAKPVDPAMTKIRYSSFDPTYYIDIAPADAKAVSLTGTARQGCTFALRTVDSTKPDALNLSQSVKMKAPANDVLNATNAAVVDITCPTAKPAKAP